jgi:hypothetical protein
VSKGSGRRPAAITETEMSTNWERTFPRRTRVKIYHYHRSQHEAIHAEFEEAADAILRERHPADYEDFELTDVQDVPEKS